MYSPVEGERVDSEIQVMMAVDKNQPIQMIRS
jgi:hypothetical protein